MSYVEGSRRWSRGRSLVGLLGAVAALLPPSACLKSLPLPATGPVPQDAAVTEVPYPPPPARVQSIPQPPNNASVWVDGQWEWDGKDWKWLAGAWVAPPANAYFTPWMTVRQKDGRLLFAKATWRAKDGRPIDVNNDGNPCPAPAASSAAPTVAASPGPRAVEGAQR